MDSTSNSTHIYITPRPDVCPGCGRCRQCGQPAPVPQPVVSPQNPWWVPNRPYYGTWC